MKCEPDYRQHRFDARNWLICRIHDTALRELAERYFAGCLVDIGCGTKPYSDLVRPFVSEHVGVDHGESLHGTTAVDRIGTAYDIPAQDSSFDCALCTAVLEHLEEPEAALRECFRVLRIGGVAIYSVPLIWHVHEEPRDFYRYTKYGLQYLFKKAGFQILEIRALSGFWVTFATLLSYNLVRLGCGPLRHGMALASYCCQWLAYRLEKHDREEKWTWAYMIVARKPATCGQATAQLSQSEA